MISKLSPAEVPLFQWKKWPQNRKRLLFGVRVAKGKKAFFGVFDIEDTRSMPNSRFHQISTSNAFSHYPVTSRPNLVRIKMKS